MKKKRFSENQIIGVLRETQAGVPVKELSRQYGFSNATFYQSGARSMVAWKFQTPNG